MKHIKLFEQFEDEEDWWEKESPFDEIKKEKDKKFRIGDEVKCIDSDWTGLIPNKIYIIKGIRKLNGVYPLQFNFESDDIRYGWWNAWRFEKI